MTIVNGIGTWPYEIKNIFLNVDKLSELRMAGSSLFYSEIVEGKKEFLKKLCFTLKKGLMCTFLEV